MAKYFLLLVLMSELVTARTFTEDDANPAVEMGADVYYDRCIICHASDGSGNGLIPLKIEGYPNTNLVSAIKNKSENEIREAVIYGGTTGKMSPYMPPMGNDLTWTQTESIVRFLLLMKTDYRKAIAMVKASSAKQPPSRQLGGQLFSAQCVLCHGKKADGKGRMSKLLNPSPANLRISKLSDDELLQIIREGGEFVGRSSAMPAWKDQYTGSEIDSIILFIKSLRQ